MAHIQFWVITTACLFVLSLVTSWLYSKKKDKRSGLVAAFRKSGVLLRASYIMGLLSIVMTLIIFAHGLVFGAEKAKQLEIIEQLQNDAALSEQREARLEGHVITLRADNTNLEVMLKHANDTLRETKEELRGAKGELQTVSAIVERTEEKVNQLLSIQISPKDATSANADPVVTAGLTDATPMTDNTIIFPLSFPDGLEVQARVLDQNGNVIAVKGPFTGFDELVIQNNINSTFIIELQKLDKKTGKWVEIERVWSMSGSL